MARSNTRAVTKVEKPAVNKGGRPTKMNPEVITKLKAAFANSFTVEQACYYAEIDKTTFYLWLDKDERFSHEMERARNTPTMKAKQVVVAAVNKGDVETSKWWLKHKAPDEFGVANNGPNVSVNFNFQSNSYVQNS